MAQWLGQYATGTNRSNAVREVEEMLRHAIRLYQASTDEGRARRVKPLRKLGKRVLRARLQSVNALLAAVRRIPTAEVVAQHGRRLEALSAAEEATRTGGLAAVLDEFGVAELGS